MEDPTQRGLARLALEATITPDAPPGCFAWAVTWEGGQPHAAFARTTPRDHPMPDDAWKKDARDLFVRLLVACSVPAQADSHVKAHTSLEWDGAWTAHRSMAAKARAAKLLDPPTSTSTPSPPTTP